MLRGPTKKTIIITIEHHIKLQISCMYINEFYGNPVKKYRLTVFIFNFFTTQTQNFDIDQYKITS